MLVEQKRDLTRIPEIIGNPASIGVVVGIIGVDPSRNGENLRQPKIWTVRELKSKPATEKIAGQLSFPAETRKQEERGKEYLVNNMIGALVDEFSDDADLIKDSIFLVDGVSLITNTISVRSGPLDLMLLIYAGPFDRRIEPTDREDIAVNGWMSLDELASKPSRNFVSQTLEKERSSRIISRTIAAFNHFPLKRVPIGAYLSEDFSIAGFRAKREQGHDVVVSLPVTDPIVLFERK